MSRDFLVLFEDEAAARAAEVTLLSASSVDGTPLFEVDNRGETLFVTFTWSRDISPDFKCRIGDKKFDGMREEVAFVAIKNGRHNGLGYFLDTGVVGDSEPTIALGAIPERICKTLSMPWRPRTGAVKAMRTAGSGERV